MMKKGLKKFTKMLNELHVVVSKICHMFSEKFLIVCMATMSETKSR